jgi:microcystin-dependent protein
MSESFLGEIKMFGGNFAPLGWAFCDGQLLPIGENEALYNLIGTTYGGDGTTSFALPDLRGRVPVHQGGGFVFGGQEGVEQVTLTPAQIPSHTHVLTCHQQFGDVNNPQNNFLAATNSDAYVSAMVPVSLSTDAISSTGQSQSHDNRQPYLCVSFIIALQGIYPSAA